MVCVLRGTPPTRKPRVTVFSVAVSTTSIDPYLSVNVANGAVNPGFFCDASRLWLCKRTEADTEADPIISS